MSLLLPKPTRSLPAERKRVRAVSRSERRKLELKADATCAELASRRVRGRCEVCGDRGIEAHHGFGKKAHPSVRWDGRNLYWLCRVAHQTAHRDRDWFHGEMRLILGNEQYEALKARSVRTHEQDDPADVIAAAKQGRFLVDRS